MKSMIGGAAPHELPGVQLPGATLPDVPPAVRPLRETWHVAYAEAKCEDVSMVQTGKAFTSEISLFAVADGHNTSRAARHTSTVLPAELERQLGSGPVSDEAVRRALARTFVATDDSVRNQFKFSGCTLTAAVIHGDTLTVANVGDSKAILDTGAEVIELTKDHRIGQSPGELQRLEQAGGHLARLNEYGAGPSKGIADGVGPVRLWPGGIMVGRAIGDHDVGHILLPNPHILQVKLPATGARLIVASDGLWDAMPAGRVARLMRSHACPKSAATQAVSSAAASRGGVYNDDVTVIVVDLLPEGRSNFKEVCQQFKSRVRTVLSSPALLALAEEAAAEQMRQLKQQAAAPQQQPAPRRGLFACFAKPATLEDSPSVTGGASVRSAGQLNPSTSLRGGSERSMRNGVVRDPSVRGCRRATSIEVVADVDTATWTAADFGPRSSLSTRPCSSASSFNLACHSPSAVVDGMMGFGPCIASLSLSSSEDEMLGSMQPPELQGTVSPAPPKPPSLYSAMLSRKHSDAGSTHSERGHKTHGSHAAAILLHHS